MFAPIEGLTLSASYAYTNGKLPRAANPFNNNALQNVFIVYTPKNAVNFAVDYQRPALGALFKAHLDLSQADGYRGSSGEATLTDSSSVLNGRLALSDINVGKGAKLQLSLWSRNMLDEEYTFYESRAAYAAIGTFGMYNEPMTYGLDATVSF